MTGGSASSLRAVLIGVSGFGPLLLPSSAVAERAAALPDPATIAVPEIATSDPKVIANGYKFFVFHNSSVTFATAYADISECRSFLPAGPGRSLPGFTPWIAAPAPEHLQTGFGPYGLVGDAIGAIIQPKLQRGQDNTVLRRCMETRGYVRYPVSEAVWNALNDSKDPAIVAVQAKIASAPKPPQLEVLDR